MDGIKVVKLPHLSQGQPLEWAGNYYCKLLISTVIFLVIVLIVMILAIVAFWSLLFTYGVITRTLRPLGNTCTV